MCEILKFSAGILGATSLMLASQAHSGTIVHTTNEAGFKANGSFTQLTEFSAFDETKLTIVDNPYIDGDVQISSDFLGVFGKNALSTAFFENGLAPTGDSDEFVVDISSDKYNMFSIEIGNLSGIGDTIIIASTNLGQKVFGLGHHDIFSSGYAFHGFVAPAGEYFTGFRMQPNDDLTLLLLSRIELGEMCRTRACQGPLPPCDKIGGCTPGGIPEPSTWALLILGFGGVGAAIRSRRLRRLSPA